MNEQNKKFIDLMTRLQMPVSDDLKDGIIQEVTIQQYAMRWILSFRFPNVIPASFVKELRKRLNEHFINEDTIKEVEIVIQYENTEVNNEILEQYYQYAYETLVAIQPRYEIFDTFTKKIEQNEIIFFVANDNDASILNSLLKNFEVVFRRLHLPFVSLSTAISPFETPIEKIIENQERIIDQEIKQEQRQQYQALPQEAIKKEERGKKIPRAKSPLNETPTPLITIPSSEVQLIEYQQKNSSIKFTIEGELISAEIKPKKDSKLFEGVLFDGTSSITIKTFINSNRPELEEYYTEYGVVGNRFKLFGGIEYDRYSKDIVFRIVDAVFLEKTKTKKGVDDASIKRVELHAHTKMSAQDGVLDVEDYVKRAVEFNHKALAVTDHNTLQALPDFETACKKANIKPIFGLEGSFVRDEESNIALTIEDVDISLNDATYVVYDVETTGLSSNFDEIIEIAAVKIQNNQIIDEFSTFVKPKQSIPSYITGLTQITNDDVRSAPSIEQVLQRFVVFSKNAILVAHNASFDNSMLYANLKRVGLFEKSIPTIDTLQLARVVYHDKLKKFNLKSVSKFFDVELTMHHRAIHDTKATAFVFMKMLQDLVDRKITSYNQINDLIGENAYKHAFPTHITLLVKNRTGIKNLNKIVSDSNTIYLHKEPRIMRSFLDNYREGLLIGSSCSSGEVFETALNKDIDELRKVVKYYDYLEIQPPHFYMHLFEKSFYKFIDLDAADFDLEAFEKERDYLLEQFLEQIHKAIQRIIKIGEELSIPVVASGDVHHLEESDLMYRKIFIDAPQVGGGRHPLDGIKNLPSQHFMSTSEMLSYFSFLGESKALELVVTNTNKISDLVEEMSLFPSQLFTPSDDFMKDRGIPSFSKACTELTFQNAKKMYGNPLPNIIKDRIEKELNSIIGNNYASIYYISHLLVKHSTDAGYIVGSRGSVGSSLVATFMNITEVNALAPHYICPSCHFFAIKLNAEDKKQYPPLREALQYEDDLQQVGVGYDLPEQKCPHCDTVMHRDGCDIPFETFLGFKGDKVPDIDLNFSGDYQTKAHEFCRELFGVDHAFRAGTVSTVALQSAIGYVKNYLEREKLEVRRCELERIASKIVGVKRSTGQHPGGIVVIPKEIEYTDVIPVQYPSDNLDSTWRTTHYDYHKFENNLLKLDILGHDDPTMIRHLMDFVESNPTDYPFSTVEEIPLSDKKVISLFSNVNSLGVTVDTIKEEVGTSGIPEFGTKNAKGLLIDIRPKTVSDLVKISGLSHGTGVWNGNAKDYLFGLKNGIAPIPFNELIGCRDDIMVYLQSKNIAAIEAFKIMESVRKGNGVAYPYEEMMLAHDVPKWYIDSCKMIEYLFPKAHAVAYVIMALRIGWFKVHRPLTYYAAYFSRRVSAFDVEIMTQGYQAIAKRLEELEVIVRGWNSKPKDNELYNCLTVALELTARGFHFKPIHLGKSDWRNFIPEDNGLIIPFSALDSLGENTAKSITDARNEMAFTSKRDVLRRTKINSTLFEKMNAMGIFDGLPNDDQVGLKLSYE